MSRQINIFALFLLLAVAPAWSKDNWSNVERIVAVGDLHGDFDQFTRILQLAGLVNGENKWIGGRTHLVQTGDVVDRGPDSRRVMDLLIALESQAKKSGGFVHPLIGNHDAMNVYGDLRYVSAGEYESYRNSRSQEVRETFYKQHLEELRSQAAGKAPAIDGAYKKQWEAKHPLGFFEQRLEFGPDGKYGRWIRKHNTVIRINDNLFVHGGLGPKYADVTLAKFNDTIQSELNDFSKLEGGMAMDSEGPLWYRGLAQGDEEVLDAHVTSVLHKLGAKRIIVGHTVSRKGVASRFHGRVIQIDVGLSKAYGSKTECLVIENGQPKVLDSTGALQEIPAADPAGSSSEPEDRKASAKPVRQLKAA